MGKILGIDLGTTNSAMAFMEGGSPTIIPNSEGARTTPSVVAILPDKARAVGVSAKNQMVLNPQNTFYSIKRLIGRSFNDPEVQRDITLLPFKLRESKSNGVEIDFGGEWLAPEAISAMVLSKLKADAESFLGEKITEAVITVPAYFDDSQRQATKNAGKIAGLDVKRIVNEPTAAALAYGFDKKGDKTIAVYDLGGGTFDISILELGDGIFEVISTNGDTHLGGDDFDQKLINYLADEFKKTNNIDLREDPAALQRLKEAAEKAKIELSSTLQSQINIPFITADSSGPKHLNVTITRSQFENIISDFVVKTMDPVKKALEDAKKKPSDIDEIILVGGMTRVPLIVEKVKEFFGKEPNKSVNPDEVVAIGAAIQAGVLSGDVRDVTLLDVTPLSLGLETLGGINTKLIERNSTIPIQKKQIFTTAADNQTSVEIHILQGEREMASDSKTLGRFILDGIAPQRRGVPQIEVTFDIDANGILKVSAQDKATGKSQHITITANTSLSDEEVDALIKDAEAHSAEDSKKKEMIELKNTVDSVIFGAENFMDENKDKIPEDKKIALNDKISELRTLLGDENVEKEKIEAALRELEALMQEVGEAMSANTSTQPTDENPPEEDTGSGDNSSDKDDKGDDSVKEGEVIQD
ncbi:molecular chaperone DnaK [Patescibacteria group bacterium]|nr:molecular chaperone DnaK [Patescibacteria group bacterium]